MTSIGRCPYEFLETFRLRDIESGLLEYSKRAAARMKASGMDDPSMVHYAKIRVTAGVGYSVLVTISLLPYGEPVYADTVCLAVSSWLDMAPEILAYVASALGMPVGVRALQHHACMLEGWARSVAELAEQG